VFISYSWDSPEHKKWVAGLATRLREAGIRAILDQWHLRPGEEITAFMETRLREADRVVMVCTDEYVRKADEREGGVGYEGAILTADILRDVKANRVIPVLRRCQGREKLPAFMGSRAWIDLSEAEGTDGEAEFERLVRELHSLPPKEPPLGPGPSTSRPALPKLQPGQIYCARCLFPMSVAEAVTTEEGRCHWYDCLDDG
jgi:hypothetical protein